jgi:hypothetical protein
MVDSREIAVNVAAKNVGVPVAIALINLDRPMRALADAISECMGDETGLEYRRHDGAERVVHHAVAEGRRGHDTPFWVMNLEGHITAGPIMVVPQLPLQGKKLALQIGEEGGGAAANADLTKLPARAPCRTVTTTRADGSSFQRVSCPPADDRTKPMATNLDAARTDAATAQTKLKDAMAARNKLDPAAADRKALALVLAARNRIPRPLASAIEESCRRRGHAGRLLMTRSGHRSCIATGAKVQLPRTQPSNGDCGPRFDAGAGIYRPRPEAQVAATGRFTAKYRP